jgi:hypothetical protein
LKALFPLYLLPNGKTVFQSFFMSTTVQPAAASSALLKPDDGFGRTPPEDGCGNG